MSFPTNEQFYMPAEWHPHRRCWMGWPCRPHSWPFDLSRAWTSYARVAQEIAQFEPVTMVTHPDYLSSAQEYLQLTGKDKVLRNNNIDILPLAMNDAWLRDTGPSFIINPKGKTAGVSWQFNGWGGSHSDVDEDNRLAKNILQFLQLPDYQAPMILEGGSFHVDGEGTLLTSEECLLSSTRNPQLSRGEIEELLCRYLGISTIIWLGQGLQDDETAGHVDNLACFVRPGVVVALISDDPQDSNYAILRDNLHRLRQAKDARGRALEIITLPQPEYREDEYENKRLTLSYINFYQANGGIILPIFDDAADQAAISTLQQLFPKRRVVTVPGLDLLYGGGCVHCITQQQPIP